MKYRHTAARIILATIAAGSALQAHAIPITRAQFDTTAMNYGFENGAVGDLSPTDGFLTVTGAHIVTASEVDSKTSKEYANDGGYGTVAGAAMRFSFASAVSAFGVSVYYNNAPVLLQVFNAQNVMLDSISFKPTDCGGICGFIGLRDNDINYAILSVPSVHSFNMYADNVIYQTQNVPEPASIALFGLGIAALGFHRRAKK